MEIIKERGTETETWYEHNFRWLNVPGWAGFSFTVNEKGESLSDNDAARENYRLCISGEMIDHEGISVIDEGIKKRSRTFRTNAIGLCHCGENVELYDQYMGACECPKCGQWYNLAGQELLPPERWDDGGESEYAY